MTTAQYGIDAASYQKGLDMAEVKSEGFAFAYLKATQGTNYIDPEYAGWAANPGGIHEIPYHYLSQEDWVAQLSFFRKVVGPSIVECMLDSETGGPANYAQLSASVDAAHAQGFTDVDLYLPHWRWVEIGSPDLSKLPIRYLIASDYPTTAPGYASALYPGWNFAGWNEYGNRKPDILQFTDNATVNKQQVDADAAASTLVWDATPSVPTPTKPVAPAGWVATVAQVQTALNRWPFSPMLVVDDVDGGHTQAAICAFQEAAAVAVDGVPGPITWSKLNLIYDATRPTVQMGSTGPAVLWVQQRLNTFHEVQLAEDSNFGKLTDAALREFQRSAGLLDDGVAGKDTNAALQL